MAYTPVEYPAEKGAFYALLKEQLEKYTENETDETAILANASAVLGIALKNINWVGFYMVKGEDVSYTHLAAERLLSEKLKNCCTLEWR